MVEIQKVDTANKAHVRRFVDLSWRLYAGCPQWVPPIRSDVTQMLDRKKHPFYEHSTADFFIAARDGKDVGRVAAMENRRYNAAHQTHYAQFYLFECEDDSEAAAALFEELFDWARARHLDTVIGPKGFSPFDGYGLLQRGFEHRQMMTMMNYNYPYYLRLVEEAGFVKEVDFISHLVRAEDFHLPERVHRIVERLKQDSDLRVVSFKTKREARKWAAKIGQAYNDSFVDNWEYVPLTEREIQSVVDLILLIGDVRLVKVVVHGDEVVGFAFAFPDLSVAMQRANGRLFPFGIIDLLLEIRRTKWISGNGMGILPRYQGRGGPALLYTEFEKSVHDVGCEFFEMTQVAETAVQMRRALEELGGDPYKNHRVYKKVL